MSTFFDRWAKISGLRKKVDRNGKKVDLFNMNSHSKCWREYQVRPDINSKFPDKTRKEYCIYDKAHEDYLYKEAWVQYLINELSIDQETKTIKPSGDLVLE